MSAPDPLPIQPVTGPLDADVVARQFGALATETGRGAEDVAHGFIQIAVQQMANAIKKISVARGYDVTRYTLQCFGGAGGQHACLVADALGMTRVFVHPLAGVLSAYGMGLADQSLIREQAVEVRLSAGALPEIVAQPQDLSAVSGVGAIYEQRLYNAGIGTYWELASLDDDALRRILKLDKMRSATTDGYFQSTQAHCCLCIVNGPEFKQITDCFAPNRAFLKGFKPERLSWTAQPSSLTPSDPEQP